MAPALLEFCLNCSDPVVRCAGRGIRGWTYFAPLIGGTMAREDRDLTRTYSRSQFVAKLRRLADALEAERPFNIQVAGERLRIPADVTFNVEHERADGEEELEFQLIWTRK